MLFLNHEITEGHLLLQTADEHGYGKGFVIRNGSITYQALCTDAKSYIAYLPEGIKKEYVKTHSKEITVEGHFITLVRFEHPITLKALINANKQLQKDLDHAGQDAQARTDAINRFMTSGFMEEHMIIQPGNPYAQIMLHLEGLAHASRPFHRSSSNAGEGIAIHSEDPHGRWALVKRPLDARPKRRPGSHEGLPDF